MGATYNLVPFGDKAYYPLLGVSPKPGPLGSDFYLIMPDPVSSPLFRRESPRTTGEANKDLVGDPVGLFAPTGKAINVPFRVLHYCGPAPARILSGRAEPQTSIKDD